MFFFFTSHARGHLNPALSLARLLVSRLPAKSGPSLTARDYFGVGCEGVVITPRPLDTPKIPGIAFRYLLEDPNAPTNGWEALQHMYFNENDYVTKAKQIVDEYNDGRTLRIIVYDFLMCWAVRIGLDLDLPKIMFSPSPMYCMWIFSQSSQYLKFLGLTLEECKQIETDFIHIPGLDCPLSIRDLPEKNSQEMYFDRHLKRWNLANGLIVNDSAKLYSDPNVLSQLISDSLDSMDSESWSVVGPRCRLVDHLLGITALTLTLDHNDRIIYWLNSQPPSSVIFIAHGSWCHLNPHNLNELALGLLGTKKRFLWAFRPSPHTNDETETDGLPKGLRALALGAGNRIEKWVNQTQVLQHPAIALFVSHCGWNSLTEAFSLCGKPIVGIPLEAEQSMNSHFAANELRLGLRINPRHEELQAKNITNVVLKVLSTPEFALNAAKLQGLLQNRYH